ncbi:sensor histidine kinase [Methylophaga sp. UBA3996]|uniref:sensor histidine kinase n=1 Tax=Methylophaga sp. UBA3996 TaxID=1946891 RepID=UPI0025A12AA6|nr:HAMP domain-containing sensor histidine kinase [Methylophaga sp. UBA3996]
MLRIQFFFRGMDNIISANMENAAEEYVRAQQNSHQAPYADGYTITRSWEAQSPTIKQYFNKPKRYAALQKHYQRGETGRGSGVMYFLIKLKIQNQDYFISRPFTKADASPLVGKNARQNRQFIITLSIGITLLLALLTWLLMKRLSQPVSRLTTWTHELTPETLKRPPPDFAYPELNEMAALIQGSLSSVNEAMEREQNFLRYTSHELRTPISVIRNNIELIHKLQQKQPADLNEKQQDIIERIDRASLTMQHLCETLLWLNREETESLAKQDFRLDELIHSLVDEMRYLLKNKPVDVKVETTESTLYASSAAARIIIGNLIRNAFQHTWDGHVVIHQHKHTVTIRNQSSPSDKESVENDQGFGLGLQLTQQLCKKLDWPYQNQVNPDGHYVTLTIVTMNPHQQEVTQ